MDHRQVGHSEREWKWMLNWWGVDLHTLLCETIFVFVQNDMILGLCSMWCCALFEENLAACGSSFIWPYLSSHVTTPFISHDHTFHHMWPHLSSYVTTPFISCDHTFQLMWPLFITCDHTFHFMWPHLSSHMTTPFITCDHTFHLMWPHLSSHVTTLSTHVTTLFISCDPPFISHDHSFHLMINFTYQVV